MAKSKFEYVKQFEKNDSLLPNCWIVVRLDGRGFHKFSDEHNFSKPNDQRALNLMNKAADKVMNEFKDIVLSYGQSDEFSFIFRKATKQFNRRASKLMTTVCSLFTAAYVYHWRDHFGEKTLQYPPSFDGRTVIYPTDKNLRDYCSWRQADCHINNLYNTVFWKLVQDGGLTAQKSQERLKGTLSSDKNEILYNDFGMNYNSEPEIFRKGSVLTKQKVEETIIRSVQNGNGLSSAEEPVKVKKSQVLIQHCDIIGDRFWNDNPGIIG